MTRKDYELIAFAMASTKPADKSAQQHWQAPVRQLAEVLAGDNPRFDRERFLRARGVES